MISAAKSGSRVLLLASIALGALVAGGTSGAAQAPSPKPVPLELDTPSVKTAPATTPQPPDSVLDTPSAQTPGDKSALGSPVAPERRGPTLQIGTVVSVQMTEAVNSGVQRNGDTVHGILSAPLQTSTGTTLPQGANVEATVVSAAKAGTVQSGGVLSLQLTHVGGVPVITDVADFNGQEGHKDVPDSAPARGSEAIVQTGALLQFHVMENGRATGLQPGTTHAGTTPTDAAGGAATNSAIGSGSRNPAPQPPVGSPNTAPGVNQRPVPGATQSVPPPPLSNR